MIPRNKRRINPLRDSLILRAMIVSSKRGTAWKDQVNQDSFSETLDKLALKGGGKLRDKNSGGSRTYLSQFEALGLILDDKKEGLKLTQAGEDLNNLHEPTATLAYQLIKFQYPSTYSLKTGVGIARDIVIRPFLFILELALDPDLNGLTDKDLIIPVVHAKTHDDYDKCKEKILELRRDGSIEAVIPNDASIRTNKSQDSSYEERIEDIRNIANTFKNYLQGVGLIQFFSLEDGVKRFKTNNDYLDLIKKIKQSPFIDFLNLSEDQAQFQYGKRIDSLKDTRRIFMPSTDPRLASIEGELQDLFLKEIHLPAPQEVIETFISDTTKKFQLSDKNIVRKAIEPFLLDRADHTQRLIELASGGTQTAEAFEKTISNIFQYEFGFQSEWTGRKRRPLGEVGAYADIFVVEFNRDYCGIIDAKSTKNTYDLPHSDVVKMVQTYIPATKELFSTRKNLELKFIAYVSHIITPGSLDRAYEIYKNRNIPVSLISAYELNNMRESNTFKANPEAVTNRLSENSVNRLF
jgi:hypothetical protein